MKRLPTGLPTIRILALLLACAMIQATRAEDGFVTIGAGDVTGLYFPTGRIIARMLNDKRDVHGIRATVEATSGSTFNINAMLSGYMDFGLTQSDRQYEAVNGLTQWAEKGPQDRLRSVFSIHHESLTLVAAANAGITDLASLKGKKVSTGSPGTSQHRIVMDALNAAGLAPETDLTLTRIWASDSPAFLQDGLIDAYFYTVGHPSENIRQALADPRKARLVPISGPAIDRLVAGFPPYLSATIPVRRLYPTLAGQGDVATFGVVATLCTTSRVPSEVVYALTREVFENFESFKRQHPAFASLTRKGMLQGLSAPLHPGAERYYRESGLIP